jgi:hypothetical protein
MSVVISLGVPPPPRPDASSAVPPTAVLRCDPVSLSVSDAECSCDAPPLLRLFTPCGVGGPCCLAEITGGTGLSPAPPPDCIIAADGFSAGVSHGDRSRGSEGTSVPFETKNVHQPSRTHCGGIWAHMGPGGGGARRITIQGPWHLWVWFTRR